jgi:hypothetical protein
VPQAVTIPERYTITVILPLGASVRAFTIEGRTAKIIAWLVQHRARVERMGVGNLAFHCGLKDFTPTLDEQFPRQPATPEMPREDTQEKISEP